MMNVRKDNKLKIVLSAAAGFCLFIADPFRLTAMQSLVLASLVLTIFWWVSGIVPRKMASLFLILMFSVSRLAPARIILTFPLSENFLLIIFSFLFSEGITNSGLADKLLQPLLEKYARSTVRLILIMVASSFLMIFIIPQPFSRIIILASIFSAYFDRLDCIREHKELRPVLMTGLFVTGVMVNLLLIRGDIILNNALMSMGQIQITEKEWLYWITVPTAGLAVLVILLYALVFHRELKQYHGNAAGGRTDGQAEKQSESSALAGKEQVRSAFFSPSEKRNLVFILLTVLLWATESLHGIRGTWIVIAAVALMFLLGLLHKDSVKAVNLDLLLFLTAAFSIGGVLKAAGIADVLFSRASALFPQTFSLRYVILTVVVVIAMHMILGSNVTTMSVAVPGILSVSAGIAPEVPMLLILFVSICGHFVLPFHHVSLLLGEGSGYYENRHLIRLGLPLTLLVPLYICTGYFLWWNFVGLI